MAQFSTPQQLERALMRNLSDVVTKTTEHYLKVLKKNVDEEVYKNPQHVPSMYERTGQFLESWIFDILPSTKNNEFGMEIYSNPELMTYNPEKSQHGSPYGDEDRREYMPEAILWGILWDYSTGEDEDWWRFPDTRDFWTPTIEEIDRTFNKKVIEFFKEGKDNIEIF